MAKNTFTDIDKDKLTYLVEIDGGQPLPGWLDFDPDALSFSGTPKLNT